MICAGIDAGSRTIKVVLLNTDDFEIIGKGITDQGVDQDRLAIELLNQVLEDSDVKRKDVSEIVATGYGRYALSITNTAITEITCQAVGVRYLIPKVGTIIDIGGQDSKLIRLDSSGKVQDFVMNDRCAAGTGRFLEIVAQRLNIKLDSLGSIAAMSSTPAAISSMCVVFAETEIIGLLTSGTAIHDIVAGVQTAIAKRIISMAGRNIKTPIIFTGGVAMVSGMDLALETALGQSVDISPDPQMTGAIGAAILASDRNL